MLLSISALIYFTRHPERSEAESNFFVPDPKRRCAPFAPHCVRSLTALRMTRTKKRRAKQGGIYEQLAHSVRTNRKNNVGEDIILPLCFNTNQPQIKENPRRGFSLFLCSAKKFTLSCVFRTMRVFRTLRSAPQGVALRTHHLLKKVDENFP